MNHCSPGMMFCDSFWHFSIDHQGMACRHDTAVRVVMPKYYDNSEAQMSADFAVLTAAGCAFTVAGRLTANGEFRGLADIHIPDILRHVGVDFKGITEEQFRMDISSTEIRRSKLAEKHDQQD